MTHSFRQATRQDVSLILDFIKGIAHYEKMNNEVIATEQLLETELFDKSRAEVVFVLEGEKEVGFALFFHNFSTFVGRAGLYLEDLFVLPEYRGKGYGKALFIELVRIALERHCGRMEWVCLNWNTPSINFYKSLGAIALNEWSTYRLNEDAMRILTQHSLRT